jgi:proline racemase
MWYCIVDAESVKLPMSITSIANSSGDSSSPAIGLALVPENGKLICKVGEMIKKACRDQYPVNHPEYDYPGVDILVFCGKPKDVATANSHCKNAVVMSNGTFDWNKPNTWTGMLDRSP